MWYREHIGGDRRPVVDTWWQTETGAHHDLAAARRHRDQAGLGACARCPASRAEVVDDAGDRGAQRRRRLPGAHRAVAVDAAHHLGRRRALPRHLLVALRRPLLRRRRRQDRRRRRPLAARPGRRRDATCPATASRPPRSSRRWSRTRRSPRPRSSAPTDATTGQAIVAFVILRGDARRRAASLVGGAARPRRPRTIGPIAKPQQILIVAGAAEDPLRQDHAPAAARRRREPRARATSPRSPTPR